MVSNCQQNRVRERRRLDEMCRLHMLEGQRSDSCWFAWDGRWGGVTDSVEEIYSVLIGRVYRQNNSNKVLRIKQSLHQRVLRETRPEVPRKQPRSGERSRLPTSSTTKSSSSRRSTTRSSLKHPRFSASPELSFPKSSRLADLLPVVWLENSRPRVRSSVLAKSAPSSISSRDVRQRPLFRRRLKSWPLPPRRKPRPTQRSQRRSEHEEGVSVCS